MKQHTVSPVGRRHRYVIIMAGGRGERFWPVSRQRRPKQLLTLLGERSFLQQAVDRVAPLAPPENLFVITNAAQVRAVRQQLPELPADNILGEPCGRDTCAAVALGAALVAARSPQGVMAVLPADHVIPEPARFQKVLRDAFHVAAREPALVTLGIQPTEPATGYGYIRFGERLPERIGGRTLKTPFHVVERFVEKPPLAKAKAYLKSGCYRWNAGMFVWSVPTITAGLAAHRPGMAEACARWTEAASAPRRLARVLARDYPALEKISIDYALLEKADNVLMAAGDFAWDDLGTWTALARHLAPDADGNHAVADFLSVDSSGNIVFDARTKQRGLVATVGLNHCILVLTDDATLVLPRDRAQELKQLVAKLDQAGRKELL
jgi:mannose-1-phosphate guanylyltransferase